MLVEELINYNFGLNELYIFENALEKIAKINEDITVKELLEIIKKPIGK